MSGVSHRRATWTKRTAQLVACGLLAASASLAVASTAIAAARATVTICHSTGSNNNPYVTNHPAADGDVGGHDGHTGPLWSPGAATWGDIIPSFTYIDKNGVQQTYPGRNNTGFGAQILANNCNIPPVALDIDKKGTQS